MSKTRSMPVIVALLLGLGVVFGAPGVTPLRAQEHQVKLEAGAKPAFAASHDIDGSSALLKAWLPEGPMSPSVLAAVEQGQWTQALASLNKTPPKLEDAPHHVFVHGYVAYHAKDYKLALERLSEASSAQGLVVDDYARWYAMRAALELERYEAVLTLAKALPSDTALEAAVDLERVKAHEALSRKDAAKYGAEAIKALSAYVRVYGHKSESSWVAWQLAQLQVDAKQLEDAATSCEHILLKHPLSAEAKLAQARFDALLKQLGAKQRAPFAARERARELAALDASFDRHQSDLVVERGQALLKLKRYKKGDPERCQLLYLVGRSYTKLRKHALSAPFYDRIISECAGQPDEVLKALYLAGKAYWNAADKAKALKRFEQLWEQFPQATYADDAMHFSARILREQGKDKEAMALMKRQVQVYPKGDMASDSHWLLVRELFERKDYKGITRYVAQVTEPQEQDLYSKGRLAYFLARAQELQGQRAEAIAGYEALAKANPLGYYALLSMQGLGRLESKAPVEDLCQLREGKLCAQLLSDDVGQQRQAPAELIGALEREPSLKKGVVLLALGLDVHAKQELARQRGRFKAQPQVLWALAWMLDRAGAYPLSHDLPRRVIEGWDDVYPGEGSRVRWEIAYPQPFYAEVEAWAQSRGIAQALIYAIMREESGFNPKIESWANAKGLMQLMVKTAEGVAKKEAIADFKSEQLFEPKVNVRLGSAYIQELSDQLGGNPALVIAGYNGGYANVKRWLDERGQLPLDLWVEDIPYGQTRNYTKRVLTSFWTYSWLYGERRSPQIAFELMPKAAKAL